jgi:hypothetical protein
MSSLNLIKRLVQTGVPWAGAALMLVSCAQTPHVTQTGPRFREFTAADVVFRCYRWEHVNITHPAYREDGFMIQVPANQLEPALERLRVGRNMAVVVLGWGYNQEDLDRLITDWSAVLRGHGFKRIVCLRAGEQNRVDGLLIIKDIRPTDEAQKQTGGG